MTLRQCRKFVISLIRVMSGLVLVFVFFGELMLPRWAAASYIASIALTTHFDFFRILLLKPSKTTRDIIVGGIIILLASIITTIDLTRIIL